MKLTFLGADREVTGSCTQLEAAGHRILIDCGMEQGRDVYENADLPYAPGTYEALLLTHAHIDHSGRIPYLYKNGYRGPIYTTDATRDLCAIMLEDSAHIQEQEAEWKNRKAMRSGADMVEPDYTVEDAEKVMQQFVPCPYETWQNLFDGPTGKIEMRFTDVGHLLGSASISLRVTEPGKQPEIIVFSGDIGNTHQPLIKDPANPGHADYLIMESTYGDRSHGPKPDYLGELTDVLQSTFDKGGNVVIPSFAVGRTQELLYFLRQIKAEGRVTGHGNFPVYVDSPLASKSTTIFRENFSECYDEEALALVQAGRNPLQFPGLHISETKEESMAINGGLLVRLAGAEDATTLLPSGGAELFVQFLALCAVPAVVEELLFRGALQGLMRPSGSAAAIFGPALLFGLLHLDLAQGLTAFACGVFLGWLAERSGSILPGMLLHFCNNTLAFLNLYLRFYAPQPVSFGVELFILFFFPVFGVWLIWHARQQGFRFSAGLRPGVDLTKIFTSPVYDLAVVFLVCYTIFV